MLVADASQTQFVLREQMCNTTRTDAMSSATGDEASLLLSDPPSTSAHVAVRCTRLDPHLRKTRSTSIQDSIHICTRFDPQLHKTESGSVVGLLTGTG